MVAEHNSDYFFLPEAELTLFVCMSLHTVLIC